jgi:hypothetical protein
VSSPAAASANLSDINVDLNICLYWTVGVQVRPAVELAADLRAGTPNGGARAIGLDKNVHLNTPRNGNVTRGRRNRPESPDYHGRQSASQSGVGGA